MNNLAISLLDKLHIAIAVVSERGSIKYRNEAFVDAFGGEAENWTANAARALAGERGWLQGFFAGSEPHTIDVDFGGRIYRVDKIMMESGENPVVALAFHDVTAVRESEQAKSDFTSMIVHDLRGPLSGIQGTLEFVLSESSRLDPVQLELLTSALQESERMMVLVNELLDFSKIQSGNFVVETEPVRVAGLLKRAVKSLQSVAARSDVFLLSAHRRDLPILYGSEQKLTQAVINIISNALKFTPSGGVISVSAQLLRDESERPESIIITVTDTGMGIRAEDLGDVFGKFKQAASKSLRGGSGTGLGLYIVKQIVEAHSGEVAVSSVFGIGTSVVIRLPVRTDRRPKTSPGILPLPV